jgi:thiamine-phosphate pyrophosphorylase
LKVDKGSMLLYVVTDRTWLGENQLKNQVEDIIRAGATFVQLREKDMPYDQFVQEAKEIKKVTDKYKVPFVINDNINIAIDVDADGVHVGQSDMSAVEVRKLIGNDKILGVSVQNVEQAMIAQESGADYVGVGAVFNTSTKEDANSVSHETLKEICNSISIPVVAIGGINEGNIMQLKGTGVDGVAVISAIFAKRDVYKATCDLLKLSSEMVK